MIPVLSIHQPYASLGFTKAGLWALQLPASAMPDPAPLCPTLFGGER